MFRILVILTILLIFGGWTELLSKTTPKRSSHPIFKKFERNCTEGKKKKLSNKVISQVLRDHSKWLKNLSASNKYRANLCNVDLRKADLRGAMLAGADFRAATLRNAKLQKANLTGVNFKGAQLDNAELKEAMLHLAIFQGEKTSLTGTSVEGAMLYQANLRGVDLRKVKGLTQSQINMACLDKETKLPPNLSRPKPCS